MNFKIMNLKKILPEIKLKYLISFSFENIYEMCNIYKKITLRITLQSFKILKLKLAKNFVKKINLNNIISINLIIFKKINSSSFKYD